MEPNLHQIKTERTAHVYTLGNDINVASEVWLVIHGYGQRASRIIRKFDKFDLDKIFVVAPEGLNKFYWHEGKREALATWMTSRHRLDEIEDYLNYLDQVFDSYILKHMGKVKFNILGFSQGCNTMWRWILKRKPVLNKIVHWAGDLPPELDYLENREYINQSKNTFLYGDKDNFITGQKKDSILQFIGDAGIKMEIIEYPGLHRIERDVLSKLI